MTLVAAPPQNAPNAQPRAEAQPASGTGASGTGASVVVPVILSGGAGSRLWPVSRASRPKQLWPLVSSRTMLQDVALRAIGPGFAPPVIVCNDELRFRIAEQMQEIGVRDASIILEPEGRNSAAAITAAALILAERDPGALLWMMPADAAVQDTAALQAALEAATVAARAGRIVLFGMRPTRPETAYGYIALGAALSGAPGVHDVLQFLEKPDPVTATELSTDGKHLWNSGMAVFQAGVLLQEMARHAPAVLEAVQAAVAGRRDDLDFVRLAAAEFLASPTLSLDYAVIEHTERAAVVPADIGWSDVGSWDGLWEQSPRDDDGNATLGDVVVSGSRNCYVRSEGILTAVVGLDDAIVVVTDDAVLAMHRDQAQNLKGVVEQLARAGRTEAVAHNRTYRPWGFYEVLIHGERFQVKRIVVQPGQRLSLQKHFHRAEHWVVVQGSAIVTRDADQLLIRENESIYLPLGCVHRLDNPGRIPLTLIEVQSGSYLGEDDIVRLEDHYGRR